MSVDEKMTALADAIREKANTSGKMTIDEMTVTVRGISVGEGDATVQTDKSATISSPSGTISPDSGYDSMSSVKYDLDSASKANLKAGNIKQGVKILGVTGNYEPPTEPLTITSPKSETYTPSNGNVGFDTVDVAINTETRRVTPTEEEQTITATDENAVLAAVVVEPITLIEKEIYANGVYSAGKYVDENGKTAQGFSKVIVNTRADDLGHIIIDNDDNYKTLDAYERGLTGFSSVEVDIEQWRGDYSAYTHYFVGDIVRYDKSVYRCIKECTGWSPMSGIYWTRLDEWTPYNVQAEKNVTITSNAGGVIVPSVILPDGDHSAMERVNLDFEGGSIDASKIKKGAKILGVTGTYEASGNSIIVGKWIFHNVVTQYPPDTGFDVNFKCADNTECNRIVTAEGNGTWQMVFWDADDGAMFDAVVDGQFRNVAYQTIDFGAEPQIIPTEFATWLAANADYKSGEDISTELAEQKTLISDIKTALENKAGGGSGIETCTIEFDGSSGTYTSQMFYTTVKDGVVTVGWEIDFPTPATFTAVKGSYLHFGSSVPDNNGNITDVEGYDGSMGIQGDCKIIGDVTFYC